MVTPRILLSALLLLGIDLPRPPSFDYVEAVGCGDLFVMAWNRDSSEVLSITVSGFAPSRRRDASSVATITVTDLIVQSVKRDLVRARKAIRFEAALHGIAG